jgi:hypothetical protein
MTLRGPKLADAEQRYIRTAAAVVAAVLVVLATPSTAAAQLSDGDLRDGACLWLSDKALAQQRSACLMRVRRVNTICHIRMPTHTNTSSTLSHAARAGVFSRVLTNALSVRRAAAFARRYGEIDRWDVSAVKTTAKLFYKRDGNGAVAVPAKACLARILQPFAFNLSTWDTSSVTDMEQAFGYVALINADVADWVRALAEFF